MNYRSYEELSELIKNNLTILQSRHFDLIVGNSKDSMVAVYIIALYLNKKCCDIKSYLDNFPLKTGITRKAKEDIKYPREAKSILLVEDIIKSDGFLENSIQYIIQKSSCNITTLCLYGARELEHKVDMILEYINKPISFEWNIFQQQFTSSACFDIDGVLCIDPTYEQDDDGEIYKSFLLDAPLLFKPNNRIKYLVTSRLEKYRTETETWLRRCNIEFESLIMLDLPSIEERQRLGINAIYKADAYKKSGQHLFFESSRSEAINIFEITGKPVYCVDTNEMFSKEMGNPKVIKQKESKITFSQKIKQKLFLLPKPVYYPLRAIYRKLKIG